MDKAQKQNLVQELNQSFSATSGVVVALYQGLSVSDMTDLRSRARQDGAVVKVAKNRLVKIALKGTVYEGISDLFTGQTVFTHSDDPVAAAKVFSSFAKENENLVILGGALGESKLDVGGVKALASLPSLDELRAKLVGLISSPATKVAQVLQAPGGQVARVIKAKSEQ